MRTFGALLLVLASGSAVPRAHAADLNEMIAQFSPNLPHWHEYEFVHPLCNKNQNNRCTKELVKAVVLRNVMPCQNPSRKMSDGDFLLPHDPNTKCVYTPGHITINVYDNVGVVAVSIHTYKDHKLFNGIVLRYVEEDNGTIVLRTRGIGNNKSDFWAAANRQLGRYIFDKQDKQIVNYLNSCMTGGNTQSCD
jgi:hypothetical protein